MKKRRFKKPFPKKAEEKQGEESAGPKPAGPKPAQPKKKKESETKEKTYIVVGGREDVISVWLDGLSTNEKREVLDIKPEEVVEELVKKGFPELETHKVDEILKNATALTAIRAAFVQALHNEGKMESPPENIVVEALYKVLEEHLYFIYTEKSMLSKVCLYLLFWIWVFFSWYLHWILRLVLIAVVLWFFWSSSEKVGYLREVLFTPFGDSSWHRMGGRLDALLCGLLTCQFGTWLLWYKISVIISLAPLILIEIEKYTPQYSDKNALQMIRTFLLWVSQIQLLYLTWFSWFYFLFAGFFFFPKLTATAISFSLLVLSVILEGFGVGQTYLLKWDNRPLVGWLLFLASLISYYWTFSSFWTLLFNIVASLLFFPPVFLVPLIFALRFLFTVLPSRGLGGTLMLTGYILLAIVAYVYAFIRQGCRKPRGEEDEEDEADNKQNSEPKFKPPEPDDYD